MNIAIIGTTAHSILGFRIDLIKALVAKGHRVYAFAQDYQINTSEQVKALGAEPIQYQFNRAGLNPFVDLYNTYHLSKQLKQCQIEQTFCYFTKPVIFGTLAAVMAGVKKRYGMLEGLGFTFTPQPEGVPSKTKLIKNVQVWLYKRMLPRLNRLILLNQDDKKDLIDHYGIKVATTILGPIGLNLDDYEYSKPVLNTISFLFIGRLLKEKGVHQYIQAAKIVKKHYPATEFVILGTLDNENPGGLKEAELQALISDGVVVWPGFVHDVAEKIKHSSVFVLPSYREGFPRSTQEAMAMGRAVITTNTAGCKETVQDGVNGFLISLYSVDELVEKMCYFIEHPDSIETMGNNSYHWAQQHFDAKKINQQLIELLDLA